MTEPRSRRRIDRVVAPDFLDGLEGRSVEELRAMRDDCRQEETRLSYLRRVLQGQADIVSVEAQRRRDRGEASDSLVAVLPRILAEHEPSSPSSRAPQSVSFYHPEDEQGRRPEDGLLEAGMLARLPDLGDDELASLLEYLSHEETRISAMRRVLLEHLDRAQEELVRRFRDGQVAVTDMLPPLSSDRHAP